MTSRPAPSELNPSLATRYGAPRRALSRGAKRVAVIVSLAVAVVLAAWVALSNSAAVTFKDLAFTVSSDTLTTATFSVEKDPAATAECAVQVMDSTYAVVGWEQITVGPSASGERNTQHSVDVRTEYLGVSASVNNCWISAQG